MRDQPLDSVRQPGAALVEGVLGRQHREQVRESAGGGGEEASVGGNPEQDLRDAERHDLRVGELAARIFGRPGQEIVRSAENGDAEQVEVGEHRGPLRVGGVQQAPPTSTSLRYVPHSTASAVASLI
jgi:hypothetical protein